MLVPLDGSKLAESVLSAAAKIATNLALEIVLFHTYTNPFSPFVSGSGPYAVNVDELMNHVREKAGAYLEATRAELSKQGSGKISCVLQEGDAAEKIVATAKGRPEALILICSHGRSGLKRRVIGSVTETVVRHSRNPMLILRG
jgi:nucleotide-binding universal stress UspA family protein